MLQLFVVYYVPGLVFNAPFKSRMTAALIAFVINYAFLKYDSNAFKNTLSIFKDPYFSFPNFKEEALPMEITSITLYALFIEGLPYKYIYRLIKFNLQSLRIAFEIWFLTVFSLMNNSPAISFVVLS